MTSLLLSRLGKRRYKGFGVKSLPASTPFLKNAFDNYKAHFIKGRIIELDPNPSGLENILESWLPKEAIDGTNPTLVFQCENILGFTENEKNHEDGEIEIDGPGVFKVKGEPLRVQNFVVIQVDYEQYVLNHLNLLNSQSRNWSRPNTKAFTTKTERTN